jgi:hypothetical protein
MGSKVYEKDYVIKDIFSGEQHVYHTNKEGEGLWVGNRQILGTTQFSIRGIKDKRGKIYRYINRNELKRRKRTI